MLLKRILQYYQIFCNLSLDVVLGVVCCMLPLPFVFGCHMNLGWYIGLPTATWMVYLLDHYLDFKRNPSIKTERHLFIQTNSKHIVVLIVSLCIFCIYLAIHFYTIQLFMVTLTIGFFCLLYFILTSLKNNMIRLLYNKELFIAIVYATAIYLAVGLNLNGFGSWMCYYIAFLLIAYLNLLLLSIVELEKDTEYGQFSWVGLIGKKRANRLFVLILISNGIYCTALLFYSTQAEQVLGIIYLLMIGLHGLLYWNFNKRIPENKIRKLSEVIFWLPVLVYLFK